MEINEIIKNTRLQMGLSQEALARELHIGFTSVNRRGNCKTQPNQIARYAFVELRKRKNIDTALIELLENTK